MALRKGTDDDIFRNVIDVGLRMYGNGHAYPAATVDYVMEDCRQQLRDYCREHNRLTTTCEKKRVPLLKTLVFTSRHRRARLKRLQLFVQTKDRSATQEGEVDELKRKRSTINDRFARICRQMHIHLEDHSNKVNPQSDLLKAEPCAFE